MFVKRNHNTFFKVHGFASRMEWNKVNSRYLSGKASKAEVTGFSFAITDISHCLGEGREREARLSPHWFRSQHLAATSQTVWTSAALESPRRDALPGVMSLPLLCASWGLSWLELALLDARHLQTGFANNWLKVLSFRDLIQMPDWGGQACFPRLPAPGLRGWGEVEITVDVGPEA